MASIARNYYREDMNLLYPRVDWRGDGPGFAEMEFPALSWSMALLYKLFGYHVVFGRLLSFVSSLLALAVFFRLSQYLLPAAGAVAAASFFALSPLVVRISKSIQPDGLMFLFYVLAAYAFVRWLDDDSWKHYFLALIATAVAILSKAPAVHIGLLFAALLLYRKGLAPLRQPRIWVFAVLSLVPAILWYAHARGFWLTYGNSLGLSNEYHWAGWDLFTDKSFIVGIGKNELSYVWMPLGVIIATMGVILRRSEKVTGFALLWLGAVFAYYLVAARTLGDSWAVYYHAVAVPPVALLFGGGVEAIARLTKQYNPVLLITVCSAFVAGAMALVLGFFGLSIVGLLGISSKQIAMVAALVIASAVVLFLVRLRRAGRGQAERTLMLGRLGGAMALGCVLLVFLDQGRVIANDIRPQALDENLQCAEAFGPLIPEHTLILASGGVSKDPTGYPVAINASYMFYWLDRKGFNVSVEDQSIETVLSFARRGARFFVAEKNRLRAKPGFEAELRQTFPLLAECDAGILFEISDGPTVDTLKEIR